LKPKKSTTTSKVLEPTSRKTKIVDENDSLKLNTIEVFDKDNKLIDGAIIIQGDLVSIKCYVQYWKHSFLSNMA
jgi:DNA integrity scanning protein DisA with diadenylate cyclase activity